MFRVTLICLTQWRQGILPLWLDKCHTKTPTGWSAVHFTNNVDSRCYIGYLYQQFAKVEDFEEALKYAKDNGVLLWSNPRKKMFVVHEVGHEMVKAFVKRKITKSGWIVYSLLIVIM